MIERGYKTTPAGLMENKQQKKVSRRVAWFEKEAARVEGQDDLLFFFLRRKFWGEGRGYEATTCFSLGKGRCTAYLPSNSFIHEEVTPGYCNQIIGSGGRDLWWSIIVILSWDASHFYIPRIIIMNMAPPCPCLGGGGGGVVG